MFLGSTVLNAFWPTANRQYCSVSHHDTWLTKALLVRHPRRLDDFEEEL